MKPWEKAQAGLKPWEAAAQTAPKKKSRKELITEFQKQAIDETSTLDAILIGAGKKTNDLVEGVKGLFGKAAPVDDFAKQSYAALKSEKPIATGTGEVLSELGQIAVPGSAVGKIAKVAPLATDVGLSAIMAGLRAPEGNNSRLENARNDAIASIAGGVIGKGLGKVIDGFGVDKYARELMDDGIRLTPEQAMTGVPGYMAGRVGPILEHLPLTGRGAALARKTGEREWHKAALQEAALPGTKVTKFGHDGFNQVNKGFTDAYKAAWRGVSTIPNATFPMVARSINRSSRSLDMRDARVMASLKADFRRIALLQNKKVGNSARHAHVLDRAIQRHLNAANNAKRTNLVDALEDVKKVYRRNMPNDVAKRLAAVDAKYPELLTVKKAVAKAADKDGAFTPKQLITSAKTVGKESLAASGKYPLNKSYRGAEHTIGKERPDSNAFLSSIAKLTGVIPEAGMRMVGNSLIGNSAVQRGARSIGRKTPEGVRRMVSPARIGASVNPEQTDFDRLLEELGLDF
jgi:hypothetical protein